MSVKKRCFMSSIWELDEIKKEYVEEELCGDRKHVWVIRSGINTYKLELYTSGELNFIKL